MTEKQAGMLDGVEGFVEEAREDYVGLWEILAEAKESSQGAPQIREEACKNVAALLQHGLVAGNLTKDGGFIPWPDQQPHSVTSRICREWDELGCDPSIDDIVWFDLPRR